MAKMDELVAEVSRQRSVEQSVLALLGGMRQQITDLKNIGGATPEQLDALLTDIKKNTDDLASAVVENTPQAAPADAPPQPADGGNQPAQ